MNAVLERVEGIISRYNMLPAGSRVGVAVSGGADSVFLLHFLAERGDLRLTVLHVNHGLRGVDSDGDAAFVEAMAEEMGLPFIGYRMGAAAGNLEQFCRRERLAFFARAMAEGIVNRVATGHTASDQAETVMMRLLRGAGTTGMRGILPVTAEGLIRPLLGVGREEVRTWLRERRLKWREDASNEAEDFLRNRVRARLLPVMRELDGECEAALGRVAELAAEDEDYWRREAGAVLDRAGLMERGALVLDRRELTELHPALLGRVVRMGLERALGSLRRLNRGHVERVAALALAATGEGAVEVPGGRVRRSMDWLRVGGEEEAGWDSEIPVEFTGTGYVFRAWVEDAGRYTEGEAAVLDWERLRPPVRVRTWAAGDQFQPEGASEAKPVKEFFERARIPSWDRRLWPMITDSDGIVWIYRFGTAARAAASSATRVCLQVRCDTVSSK
jgi:tRNA(Ile)-lysidine synthase